LDVHDSLSVCLKLIENGSPENLPGGKEVFHGAEEGFIDALLFCLSLLHHFFVSVV